MHPSHAQTPNPQAHHPSSTYHHSSQAHLGHHPHHPQHASPSPHPASAHPQQQQHPPPPHASPPPGHHPSLPPSYSQPLAKAPSNTSNTLAYNYPPLPPSSAVHPQSPNGMLPYNTNKISSSEMDYSITSGMKWDKSMMTINTILTDTAFTPIMPGILSFLTVVELMFLTSVSRRWHSLVVSTCRVEVHRLHLGQFWSRLGVLDNKYFIELASRFHRVNQLTLGYCSHLTSSTFSLLLQNIPNVSNITRLNLYYCIQLTDESVENIIIPSFPRINDLNLGRCVKITDRSILALANVPTLSKLSLVSCPHISEELVMLLDDPNKFPALRILNVVNCTKLRQEYVDECAHTRPQIKWIGPTLVYHTDKNGRTRTHKDLENAME